MDKFEPELLQYIRVARRRRRPVHRIAHDLGISQFDVLDAMRECGLVISRRDGSLRKEMARRSVSEAWDRLRARKRPRTSYKSNGIVETARECEQ